MMKRIRIGILYFTFAFLGVLATGAAKELPCRLEISQVLEARIGRGPPYLMQILQENPPNAEFIVGESHGDHHLSCTYQVRMNGRDYRYEEEFPNTRLKLKEEYCGTREAKKKVRQTILSFTDRCQNPKARPRRGNPLQVRPGPPLRKKVGIHAMHWEGYLEEQSLGFLISMTSKKNLTLFYILHRFNPKIQN